MSAFTLYPWQTELWQQLMTAPEQLPHALLLVGPTGLGKQSFAMAMAARLLCETPVEQPGLGQVACGHCSSCNWLAAGSHPDFRLLQPQADEEDETAATSESEAAAATTAGKSKKTKATAVKTVTSGPIRIDQVRGLADFVFVGSHRHGRRIVILQPAEAMNPAAANALLKILEEPPASVCFLLISHAWRNLLPTIRSRCRVVTFGRPATEQATQWLQAEGVKDAANLLSLAGGAPLLARDWAQQDMLAMYRQVLEPLQLTHADPVDMAAKWAALLKAESGFDLPQLVDIVQKWVADLTQLVLSGSLRYHPGWREQLEALAKRSNVSALLGCDKELRRIRAVARHPLNTTLYLEDMAARYLRIFPARNS